MMKCKQPCQASSGHIIAVMLILLSAAIPSAPTLAQTSLSLNEAFLIAKSARAELRVAAARVDAASQRPAIVSSLDDPILSPAIDHKPVDPMMRSDRSITLEQSFPLSHILQHKRRAAEADIEKYQAEISKTALKIYAEVAQAFFMLQERRRLREILEQQVTLAAQLSKLVATRYGTGSATQSDVLRLEMEEARLRGRLAVVTADAHSAAAMLNASLGRAPDFPLPALDVQTVFEDIAAPVESDKNHSESLAAKLRFAQSQRAELRVAQAEKRRADAEIDVMKSMYAPMAMVKVGVADTMTAGRGYMLMVGVSIPIWRERLHAGVREAKAMSNMAQADRDAMLSMIQGELAAAQEALRGATLNYRSYRNDLLPRAERTLTPTLSEYASGRLPLSAVLETSKALWALQEESLMAETALGVGWIRMRLALGDFGEKK